MTQCDEESQAIASPAVTQSEPSVLLMANDTTSTNTLTTNSTTSSSISSSSSSSNINRSKRGPAQVIRRKRGEASQAANNNKNNKNKSYFKDSDDENSESAGTKSKLVDLDESSSESETTAFGKLRGSCSSSSSSRQQKQELGGQKGTANSMKLSAAAQAAVQQALRSLEGAADVELAPPPALRGEGVVTANANAIEDVRISMEVERPVQRGNNNYVEEDEADVQQFTNEGDSDDA